MAIEYIKLLTFRNYNQIELGDFSNTNLLVGDNGSGKTNFIEAIYITSMLAPLRKVAFKELISWNQKSFYIRTDSDGDSIEVGYSLEKRLLQYNNNPIKAGELAVLNPVVAFLPDDIDIIAGSPSKRRSFIDKSISKIDVEYSLALLRYSRALRQRNAQLKIRFDDARLWNNELIKWGSIIIEKRLRFVQLLNRQIQDIYSSLYGEKPDIRYMNTFKIHNDIINTDTIAQSFGEALVRKQQVERFKQHTVVGPHRDNFEIKLSGLELGDTGDTDIDSKIFASHGQLRSLSIALKLAVVENIYQATGKKPIVLLDDVLLEVDKKRRALLLQRITPNYQTFITATSLDFICENIENYKIFNVVNGHIKTDK